MKGFLNSSTVAWQRSDFCGPLGRRHACTKSNHTEDIHKHIDYWVAVKSGRSGASMWKATTSLMRFGVSLKTYRENLMDVVDTLHRLWYARGRWVLYRKQGRTSFFCEKHVSDEVVSNKKGVRRDTQERSRTALRVTSVILNLWFHTGFRIWQKLLRHT